MTVDFLVRPKVTVTGGQLSLMTSSGRLTPQKNLAQPGWSHDPTHELGSRVYMNQVDLENKLIHERAQVDKLKALFEAERAHV